VRAGKAYKAKGKGGVNRGHAITDDARPTRRAGSPRSVLSFRRKAIAAAVPRNDAADLGCPDRQKERVALVNIRDGKARNVSVTPRRT